MDLRLTGNISPHNRIKLLSQASVCDMGWVISKRIQEIFRRLEHKGIKKNLEEHR